MGTVAQMKVQPEPKRRGRPRKPKQPDKHVIQVMRAPSTVWRAVPGLLYDSCRTATEGLEKLLAHAAIRVRNGSAKPMTDKLRVFRWDGIENVSVNAPKPPIRVRIRKPKLPVAATSLPAA